MYRKTSTHIQENEDVCTQKSSCFLFHTNPNMFASTFSVEQELSDNSPDGQTRNQTSISLPASSSPYPFNHSISFAHTHRHLPHTWKCNYIFHFPTTAVQLPRWKLPHLINQNHRGPLIVKHNKILANSKQASLRNLEPNTVRDAERSHINSFCILSSYPLLLRAPCYLST